MNLVVKNLSVSRNDTRVLHKVSFTCASGEATILRGPNGVGKTTLLRTLAGFIPASSGTANLFQSSLEDRDAFQSNLVYFGHLDAVKAQMTVSENIRFWAKLYGQDDISTAFESFDLNSIKDRLAGKCSAGQKRRLGLARLLIAKRSLWLLDEPTVSLDDTSRHALKTAIESHLSDGGMAVIATHDADLVSAKTFQMTPPPQVEIDDAQWDEAVL